MFREMRRIKQLLSKEETEAVINRCTSGVLACMGDEGYPYAVPLNYVYYNGKIYFHSAKEGHKIDAILKNPKVSFAVIDEDKVVSEEYTTYYRSAIAFGKARIAEGDEYREAFRALVEKYSGDQPEEAKRNKIDTCHRAYIIAIDIEHITGKESIKYVKVKEHYE
ncbi:MAG TPA: pyridoxamine 5'-phosphate oxidase family protein [Clostridiales bacterium]|nr:pyridoxamine 5'-phosphate oxidase family protein [Clostridiales bacterium]